MSSQDSLGFAVGGAQDINNFRANIQNDFLPIHTDVTYEGLFYDYYFDTGASQPCEELFCPSYSYAISEDPFSGDDDYYLSVGLDSGLKASDFERKKLNLVIVLDVSGSMNSPFNQYHYDDPNRPQSEDSVKSKTQLANESLVGLLENLEHDDNLGIVLFNDHAHMSKPLESIGITDKELLAANILEIHAFGGTNMESGVVLGTSLLDKLKSDPTEYENRMIIMTDAMPNLGDATGPGLMGMISDNSEEGIYTTFVGIGVDFNTGLIEKLTKVRGANYYSVHSASEFKSRMIDEFDFMVTPLVFDLRLQVDADGYKISKVYGSPEADESTGQIMKINTLFPSETQDGETRGGIVLLKLEKTSDDATITLRTSYEDRSGRPGGDTAAVRFGEHGPDYFENTGIQKGILLSRYAEIVKTWIVDERTSLIDGSPVPMPPISEYGIQTPRHASIAPLGEWERRSAPLQVSDHYEKIFSEFSAHFYDQMRLIGDDSLQQELDILYKLENY